MIPDDSAFCPLCGASVAQAQPQPAPEPVPQAVPQAAQAAPVKSNIEDSMFFKLLPFIAAATFTLGALIFFITSIIFEAFIVSGLFIFIASVVFLVAQVPGFVKAITKK